MTMNYAHQHGPYNEAEFDTFTAHTIDPGGWNFNHFDPDDGSQRHATLYVHHATAADRSDHGRRQRRPIHRADRH